MFHTLFHCSTYLSYMSICNAEHMFHMCVPHEHTVGNTVPQTYCNAFHISSSCLPAGSTLWNTKGCAERGWVPHIDRVGNRCVPHCVPHKKQLKPEQSFFGHVTRNKPKPCSTPLFHTGEQTVPHIVCEVFHTMALAGRPISGWKYPVEHQGLRGTRVGSTH